MKLRSVAFLFFLMYTNGYSQIMFSAFGGLTVSRSALTFGAGSQGVALDGGLDAMQYNPAAIASLSTISFESGKRDAFIVDPAYAISWYRFGFSLKGIGAFALEYNQIDYGVFNVTRYDPNSNFGYDDFETIRYIERSYALSYAASITGSLSLGGTIRYIPTAPLKITVNQLLFSAGLLYQPAELGKHVSIGFSLTNFGTPVRSSDPAQSVPPPAYMHLGVGLTPLYNEHQKLTFLFEGSRPVDDVDGHNNARSSFAALFSSFKYWPHDIMGHGGLIYSFPDIPISETMSFHQQLAFGVFDETINSSNGYNQMSTSGLFGVTLGRFSIDIGVASVWQYISENTRHSWFLRSIPDEELELRLSYSPTETLRESGEKIKTTVTARIGSLSPLGRLKDLLTGSGVSYGIEMAQYIAPSTAIVPSFSFERNKIGGTLSTIAADGKWNTYTFAMLFRYDFTEQGFPLYLQAGPTLFRTSFSSSSPYIEMLPRYKYDGGISAGAGIPIAIDKSVIVPYIDILSMLSNITGSAPRLGGYNQLSYGIKVGLTLK
jgi:hypothetical protein